MPVTVNKVPNVAIDVSDLRDAVFVLRKQKGQDQGAGLRRSRIHTIDKETQPRCIPMAPECI